MSRRSALLLLAISLVGGGCAPSQESGEQVRQAVSSLGLLGQSPEVVEERLRALVLPSGSRLEVGAFEPRFGLILSQTRDEHMRPRRDFNVDVTIQFDSTRRAVRVVVAEQFRSL